MAMRPVSPTAHWRDSARQPRLLVIDYRATFAFLFWLFFPRWWSFFVAVGAIVFFSVIELYGFSVIVFFRWFRQFIAGPYKSAYPWWQRYPYK